MRGFIPWAAIVVLAVLLWDARKAMRNGGPGVQWKAAKLLVLWIAYVALVWSTSAIQGGSGALLLLWVLLLLPCGYVTWRWFRSASG